MGFLSCGSADLSENLQPLSHCHCFNNNETNNENSDGSFKNFASFFWYGPRAATALQGGGIAGEAAVLQRTGYAGLPWVVWWCIAEGVYPVVVAVGLSPFGVSVGRLKPRENCPKLLRRELPYIPWSCISQCFGYVYMKWKNVSVFARACQDSNFLRKWLFSVITNAAFKRLWVLNTLAVLLVRNIVTKALKDHCHLVVSISSHFCCRMIVYKNIAFFFL